MISTFSEGTVPMMRRTPAAALVSLSVLLLAVAAANAGDTFIYYEDEMSLSSNPIHELSMSDVRLNELVHGALYAPNYADQPNAMMVKSAELDETGRVMTMTLKDLKWSDGKPVTADDVVFTLLAYKNPESKSLDRNRWDFIMKAEALDEKRVQLTFMRTYREPPAGQLYLKVIPSHVFKNTGIPRNHSYRTNPVTAGPYIVQEKDRKNWILRRYADSPRVPKVGEVRCQEVPEKRTQAELMSYEYGHAMIEVNSQQRAELDADQCCTLKPYPSKSWWYTAFNQSNPHLANAKVRKAISVMLNRQQALDLIGEGELISGPFTLSSRYYNHDVVVPESDVAKATALMEEAGYSKKGGQWTKGGKTVDLRFFYDEELGEQGQTVATNIVGQLKGFGLNANAPSPIGGTNWEQRIMQNKEYDMVMSQWSFDVNEDIGQLFQRGGVRNFVGYSDDRTDQLLSGAYESQDPSEQQAYMKEIHRRLAETSPYVFLWSLRNFSAISWDVAGAHIQAYFYFSQFSDWDIKKD